MLYKISEYLSFSSSFEDFSWSLQFDFPDMVFTLKW